MSFPVTLVGSRGQMGAMFRAAWSERHDVRVVDRTRDASGSAFYRAEDIAAGIPHGDVVVLCIPAPTMPAALDLFVPHLRKGQILADVCSVKINPIRWMEERFAGPVVGTHPLFGPENTCARAKVALVRGKNASDADVARVGSLFQEMDCAVFNSSAEEHDSAVGITQSLHFALAAAYFAVAAEHPNLESYVTPSFLRFRDAARSELTDNAPMFGDFTAANPAFPDLLKTFAERLQNAGLEERAIMAAKARYWYP